MSYTHIMSQSLDEIKQLLTPSYDAVEVVEDNRHPFDDIEQFEEELMHSSVIGDVLIINRTPNQYPRLIRVAFNGFKCDVASAQALKSDQLHYA